MLDGQGSGYFSFEQTKRQSRPVVLWGGAGQGGQKLAPRGARREQYSLFS